MSAPVERKANVPITCGIAMVALLLGAVTIMGAVVLALAEALR